MNRNEELLAIKKIPTLNIVKSLGIRYSQQGSRTLLMAEWRDEQNSSVHIWKNEKDIWKWFDWGTRNGGSNIDLVCISMNWNYIETIKWLRNQFLTPNSKPNHYIVSKSEKNESQKKSSWRIIDIKELSDQKIKLFMDQRSLDYRLLQYGQIKKLYAEYLDKRRFWINGIRNNSNGWELFNPFPKSSGKSFKSGISPKSFSVIITDSDQLLIAESMVDCLSVMKLYNLQNINLLSLNSKTMTDKAIDWIRDNSMKCKRIIFALDRDKPGVESENQIKDALKNDIYIFVNLPFKAKDPNDELRNV